MSRHVISLSLEEDVIQLILERQHHLKEASDHIQVEYVLRTRTRRKQLLLSLRHGILKGKACKVFYVNSSNKYITHQLHHRPGSSLVPDHSEERRQELIRLARQLQQKSEQPGELQLLAVRDMLGLQKPVCCWQSVHRRREETTDERTAIFIRRLLLLSHPLHQNSRVVQPFWGRRPGPEQTLILLPLHRSSSRLGCGGMRKRTAAILGWHQGWYRDDARCA